MGHATRLTPIIDLYIKEGFNPIVATSEPLTDYFKTAFPTAKIIKFDGPKIRYSKSNNFILKSAIQVPIWILWIFIERIKTKRIAKKYNPILIVSDNRYGARSKKRNSILITHQIFIQLPKKIKFLEPLLNIFIKNLVSKFNQCWIPDYQLNNGLSGYLSHKKELPKNTKFIGPLSRFMVPAEQTHKQTQLKADILVILSGPEPQRTILQDILMDILSQYKDKEIIFILGKPHREEVTTINNITLFPHLPMSEFKDLIINTPIIISRAGYSSIMDFHFLNKKAILIPTPGQSEQEYLAMHLSDKFPTISQNDLTINSLNQLLTNIYK